MMELFFAKKDSDNALFYRTSGCCITNLNPGGRLLGVVVGYNGGDSAPAGPLTFGLCTNGRGLFVSRGSFSVWEDWFG